MEDILKTKCQWCGVAFEATPDSFVEVGFTAFSEDHPDYEKHVASEGSYVAEDWKSVEQIADDLKISVEECEKLLSGEVSEIETGAEAVCPQCMKEFDKAAGL